MCLDRLEKGVLELAVRVQQPDPDHDHKNDQRERPPVAQAAVALLFPASILWSLAKS